MTQTTTIERTISKTNGTGFLTAEEPARWYNLSRFANPAPRIPEAGTKVRVTLDSSGFVRKLEPLAAADQEARSPAEDADERLEALRLAVQLLAGRADAAEAPTAAEAFHAWLREGRLRRNGGAH